MNLVFTFQVQDGMDRRNEHYTTKLPDTATKEEINAKGEELLAELWTGDEDDEWRWDRYNEKAARYYSYDIIPCDESFRIIERII